MQQKLTNYDTTLHLGCCSCVTVLLDWRRVITAVRTTLSP